MNILSIFPLKKVFLPLKRASRGLINFWPFKYPVGIYIVRNGTKKINKVSFGHYMILVKQQFGSLYLQKEIFFILVGPKKQSQKNLANIQALLDGKFL